MASTSLDSLLDSALAGSKPASAQDMVVLAVHACLLSSGYECIAIGDENFGEEYGIMKPAISSSSQPALPEGWNSSQEVCALQYRHIKTKRLGLVKVIPLGGQLLVSAVAACDSKEVFTTTLGVANYVGGGTEFSSSSRFTNLLQLVTVLNRDIESKLSNVCNSAGGMAPAASALAGGDPLSDASGRRDIPRPDFDDDPLRVGPPRFPGMPPDRDSDPLRVGPPLRPGRPIRDPDPLRDIPRPDFDDDPLRVGPPRFPGMPPDRDSDPLRVSPPLRPGRPIRDPDPLADVGPFGYGDRDRLPFGGVPGPGRIGGVGGGGGMIYDPMRQGGRPELGGFGPRGPFPPSHPPGARFDPVTPFAPGPRPPNRDPRNPGRNFYGEPNPDHLPPPGYDDMFS